ncbi:hypothetical protein ACWF9G_06700 [Nocardia sp. NPDC055029]
MWRRTTGQRATVDAIQARLAREAACAAIAQDDEQTGRDTVIVHSAPVVRFSIDQARTTVRDHRGCDRTICPRKMAAINVLVGAGLMKLDRRVGY